MGYSGRIIAIPAGKCPVKLNSTEKQDVIDWAEDVYSVGVREDLTYLPSALIFFAQQFYSIFTEEYKTVCNHLNSTYNTNNADFDNLIQKISIEKRTSDLEKIEKKLREEEKYKKKLEKKAKQEEKQAEKPAEEVAKKKIIIRRK